MLKSESKTNEKFNICRPVTPVVKIDMIDIEKAIRIVRRETPKLGIEKVTLSDAVGRVLADNIVADMDLPPFDRSQMDGYAVSSADLRTVPVSLTIVGESAAGRGWHRRLNKGQAVRIMTGAPVPAGADAVIKIELTKESGDRVEMHQAVKRGTSIVKKGAEAKAGTIVLRKGAAITPSNIAALAAFGCSKAPVAKRPRVAILATGSEIVAVAKKPRGDQIRNSNSVMLEALAVRAGAQVEIVPPAGDNLSDLRSQISDSARDKEILIVTGGVSVGKYDLTKAALAGLGAEIFFEKLSIKPGKPAVFARLGNTLVFALPGNPVSAAVTFYLLVRTAIMSMQGARNVTLRTGVACVSADAKADNQRDSFVPATLATDEGGRLVAKSLRNRGSSDLVAFANADSLIVVRAGKMVKAGGTAEIRYL